MKQLVTHSLAYEVSHFQISKSHQIIRKKIPSNYKGDLPFSQQNKKINKKIKREKERKKGY